MCRSGAGCWSLSVAASCCGEVKIEIVRVEHCIYERRHDGSTFDYVSGWMSVVQINGSKLGWT